MNLTSSGLRPRSISSRLHLVVFLSLTPIVTLLAGTPVCLARRSPQAALHPKGDNPDTIELQKRLQAQRAAVQSADPALVIQTSQKLNAIALRLMGEIRLQQAAYAQALQLNRVSQELEDSPESRRAVMVAAQRAESSGISLPKDLDSLDIAAAPDASALRQANLDAALLQTHRRQEKRLRQVLSASYNDWGTAEAHQELYSQALVHFHEAERWDRSTPGLMRNVGLAALKLGDDKETARALRFAVQQAPQDTAVRLLLATSLFSTKQYGEAARSFNVLGEAAVSDPQMRYAWAFSLAQSGQPQQANAILQKLTAQPLSADMLLAVGEVYSGLGNYSRALVCFQKAIQQNPTIKKAHDDAGSALLRLDRATEAIPELEAELKISPGEPDTQYRLASALLQTSQQGQAITVLRSLVSAHPDHARARYDLGKQLLETGNTEEAIANLEAAVKLDSEHDYIHYQLQAAYRKAGRTEDAERELKLYREIKAHNRQRPAPQL